MKKLLLLFFGVLLLVSCKKDYNCTCNYKENYGGEIYNYEESFSISGANKTQAQAACNEATLKQDLGSGDYYERTCTMK